MISTASSAKSKAAIDLEDFWYEVTVDVTGWNTEIIFFRATVVLNTDAAAAHPGQQVLTNTGGLFFTLLN